jgi:tetratricopeptide (TPR) repeat protein
MSRKGKKKSPDSRGRAEKTVGRTADTRQSPNQSLSALGGEVAPKARSFRHWHWLFAAALVAAVFVVYQPAWHGGLIWDDDDHVTRPELRSWHGLYRIWFDIGATPQYYPMVCSAFWVEHKLWGDTTLGYHLVNILLHAMSALMVALILRRLAIPGAYLAAAIFAFHPLYVESVAWITELKNTLSGVFYLGAMLLYLRFDQTRKAPWYLGALGLFVLALLSKTATVMLPAVLPLIFWWQRGRLSWKRDLLPLLPFFLASATAGMLTVWVERNVVGAVGGEFNLTLVERCLLAGRVVWFYLGKLCWPTDLLFMYPRWNISQTVGWQYLFPAATLLLLAVLWRLRLRWRGPLAALLFFAGTLFPVLGFFNVYFFQFSFVADHFQYLASLGIITLFSAGVALLLKRVDGWRRVMGRAGCLALLAALAVLSWRQSRMYTDIEKLYSTTIDGNPDCWLAHNNLGNILAGRGRVEEAIFHCLKALKIKPNFAKAHNNLGRALAERGQLDKAIVEFRKALDIEPDYDTARYNLAIAHFQLGNTLASSGHAEKAIAHFQKALELKPDHAETHNNLGLVLAGRGQVNEAIAQYRKALEVDPRCWMAHNSLGNALADRGQLDEAIVHYRKALEIKPDAREVHQNLATTLSEQGRMAATLAQRRAEIRVRPDDIPLLNDTAWMLATNPNASLRNGEEAVELAQRALKLTGGKQPRMLDTLAAAYAEAGRFPEALQTARKALELARQQDEPALAESLQAKIRLYQAGTPFRESPQLPAEASVKP